MILDCCLPTESGPYFNPSEAVPSPNAANDHRLGAPLPHQLPSHTKAYPIAVETFQYPVFTPEANATGRLSPTIG